MLPLYIENIAAITKIDINKSFWELRLIEMEMECTPSRLIFSYSLIVYNNIKLYIDSIL